jgi:hypothetical protein
MVLRKPSLAFPLLVGSLAVAVACGSGSSGPGPSPGDTALDAAPQPEDGADPDALAQGPPRGDADALATDAPSNGFCPLPPCLAALVEGCPTTGSCTTQPAASGSGSAQCYAGGVKVNILVAPPLTIARVGRPDGSLCYSVEGRARAAPDQNGDGGGEAMLVYRDPAGSSVASGIAAAPDHDGGSGSDIIVTCAAGGTPVVVPRPCVPAGAALGALLGADARTGACTAGPCP